MSTPSVPDLIMQGITQHRCLSIVYNGIGRVIEPYTIGISRASNPVVRAWQVSGASISGQNSGWKLLEISKLGNVFLMNTTFQPNRPGYNPYDKGMISIYQRI